MKVVFTQRGGGLDEYVTLLLHGDGADGATTTIDHSDYNNSITLDGATLDTAQAKFGASSILFDGVDDFATVPDSDIFWFGQSDFTIDFQIMFSSTAGNQTPFTQYSDSIDNVLEINFTPTGFEFQEASNNITKFDARRTIALANTTWYHIAVVKEGTGQNPVKFFFDGTSQTISWTVNMSAEYTLLNHSSQLIFGVRANSSSFFNGWIDEIRITKGLARWSTDFTPPSAAYSADRAKMEIPSSFKLITA